MNILFVCTGNTCRSAMAQAIAKQLIKSDPHRYGQIKVAPVLVLQMVRLLPLMRFWSFKLMTLI